MASYPRKKKLGEKEGKEENLVCLEESKKN
jgi:hypothetical protein